MFASLRLLSVLLVLASLHSTHVNGLSVSWNTTLTRICSSTTSPRITESLLECDKLVDPKLSKITEKCIRKVYAMSETQALSRPRICYYQQHGQLLDRCKMAQYRLEGVTMSQLIDRQQEHAWCLMKIAEPLGWESLCSESNRALVEQKSRQIHECETRFRAVTAPIRACLLSEVPSGRSEDVQQSDAIYPAACLSFQYSRNLWKCLANNRLKSGARNAHHHRGVSRLTALYIQCLRRVKTV